MIKSLISKYWRESIIVVLICVVGFLSTRKDKVKIETVVEIKEKIVTKVEERVVLKDRDVVKTRVVTVNKEGERREEERTESKERTVDRGVSKEEAKEVNNRRTQSVEKVYAPETFLLGGSWYPRDSTYNLGFHVRVLPNVPVYPGVVVKYQDKKFGVGIGVQVGL
jgi:exopolysaccharide biosynthesis protein